MDKLTTYFVPWAEAIRKSTRLSLNDALIMQKTLGSRECQPVAISREVWECAGDKFDLDNKDGWNECAGNNFNLDDEFDLGENRRNMISLTNS